MLCVSRASESRPRAEERWCQPTEYRDLGRHVFESFTCSFILNSLFYGPELEEEKEHGEEGGSVE